MPKNPFHRSVPVILSGVISVALIAGCSSSPAIKAVSAPVTITAPTHTVTANATVRTTVTKPAVTVTVTGTAIPDPTTSADDTESSVPTGLTVGGPGITAKNDDGGATIDVLSVQRKKSGTGDYSDPPKNGNYVLIDMSYLCTSGTWDYNPYDWNVRYASGRTYDSSGAYSSGYDDQALHSATLGKGAKARGTLIFDAPKTGLTLEYDAGFGSAPTTWIIPA
jgi:hypothetical protein